MPHPSDAPGGDVVLSIDLDERGVPANATLISSPDERLTATVIDNLGKCRFEIARDADGKPIRRTIPRYTFHFESVQPASREQGQPSRPGDPYILQLVDQIGAAWTVPTTLTDAQLAKLTAVACLTISESGPLSYKIVRLSGNEQFDRSLDAALSAIKQLPPPPDRDLATPRGPKNLKYLATHGKLCAELSPPAK
jgi:hypothetical protein